MPLTIARLQAALSHCWPQLPPPELAHAAVRQLVLDSRQVQTGDVFVAVPGVSGDGRAHVAEALAAGALLVLYHLEPGEALPAAVQTSYGQRHPIHAK